MIRVQAPFHVEALFTSLVFVLAELVLTGSDDFVKAFEGAIEVAAGGGHVSMKELEGFGRVGEGFEGGGESFRVGGVNAEFFDFDREESRLGFLTAANAPLGGDDLFRGFALGGGEGLELAHPMDAEGVEVVFGFTVDEDATRAEAVAHGVTAALRLSFGGDGAMRFGAVDAGGRGLRFG